MNVAIVISICAVLVAAVPIYYLAKSNARENERLRQEATKADIAEAVNAVQAKLDTANESLRLEREKNVRLIARNEQLEDQLYGRRTQ